MSYRLTVLLSLVAWLAAGAAGHAAAAPAASPEIGAALAELTGDDADKREAAVAVLGQTRDPKWIQFLSALRDGSVYARTRQPDGGGVGLRLVQRPGERFDIGCLCLFHDDGR